MRVFILSTVLLLSPSAHALLSRPALKCESAAAAALRLCVQRLGQRVRDCYLATGVTCPATDATVAATLGRLDTRIRSRCPDDATVQTIGWGPQLTRQAVVDRMQAACVGTHATLAARTFGGPQGAVLAAADTATRTCLAAAHTAATTLVATTLKRQSPCIERTQRAKRCNLERLGATLAIAETRALDAVTDACPDLATPIGLDGPAFTARATAQARCLTVTAHGDTGLLTLDCGPRDAVPALPRGQWTQVVLDEATWGTRCGDGSSYAFWMRLAPPGSPLERVAIDLQGGSVCVFESDCQGVDPTLLSASDDGQPSGGYLGTDPATNPLADWTMVYLPYCTQDAHIGNGTTSAYASMTVHRFGAINLRTTLSYVRDVLWTAIDAEEAEGYRPDRLSVLLGGESAGGYGVAFNYHYVLDDLGWSHTTAAPDSGLGLDNGQVFGMRALGGLVQSPAPPLGWDTRPLQPPYCLAADCAVGPLLQAATAPRLKAVPEQQILNFSNQIDDAQVSMTFFTDGPQWTNAVRASYCANRGRTGLHYFFPASSSPSHTMLRTDSSYTGLLADTVSPAQYLADAFADPSGVTDRVDNGTLVLDHPGVAPFPCGGSAGALSLPDVNGDGMREWLMAGDSNTQFLQCAFPKQLQTRYDPSQVAIISEGIFGSSARYWVMNDTLGALLATHQPDAVLIALGTNDLTRPADVIFADLLTLYDRAAGWCYGASCVVPYLATVPPLYSPPYAIDRNPTIAALNGLIRAGIAAERVVDFDSFMPDAWDASVMWKADDAIHLGCGGHEVRADVCQDVLAHAP